MKKVVSVFFCIVVLFGLFAFSAGASAPILCPHCGSTAKLVGSREEGMYIVYKYRCTNSACGHTFESKFLAGGGSTRGGGAGRRDPLPGYSSDGVPNYNQSGVLTWQPSFPDDGDKGWNTCPVGALDIYCGYFGSGKTLSLVHKVVGLYNRYNDKPVWCNRRKKFVTQKIVLLSNVDLAVPYDKLDSLAQVVKMSKVAPALDDENDTLTVTIVAMDELSVQMNSRSFKDNFNAYFLNTLLCCRHYHISFYGSAQRFQHVDKLLRDVTHTVIQCKKLWRFQLWSSYDAWEMENATNAEMIKPLRSGLWFVLDKDYNAYDTLAVVDNLQKKFEEGDILPESEIINNQAPAGPLGLDVSTIPSRKGKQRIQSAGKR